MLQEHFLVLVVDAISFLRTILYAGTDERVLRSEGTGNYTGIGTGATEWVYLIGSTPAPVS